MLYPLTAALLILCAAATPARAQAWHERPCDAPPIGRDQLILRRAERPTLPPARADLVVVASVSDSATVTPLTGFAVWLARPEDFPGDSLGSPHISDSLSALRIERQAPGEHRLRIRRIAFKELRGTVTLRPGFVDTIYAHLRTERHCPQLRPAAQ